MTMPDDRLDLAVTFSDYTKAVIADGCRRLEEARRLKETSVVARYFPHYAPHRIANNKTRLLKSGLNACVNEFGYINATIISEFSRLSQIEEYEISEFVKRYTSLPLFKFSVYFPFTVTHPIFTLRFYNTISEKIWYFKSMLYRIYLSIICSILLNIFIFFQRWVEHTLYPRMFIGYEKISSFSMFFISTAVCSVVYLFLTGFFLCFLSMLFPPQAWRRHNQALGIA